MDGSPLDPWVTVTAEDAPVFNFLCKVMPGGDEIREGVHQRELDVASQPPVINVTVTHPDGSAVPGHYRMDLTGEQPEVTYYEDVAPPLTRTRAMYHVVRNGQVEPGGWAR